MPYEPLVLLQRLAPEDVNQLLKQNPPPPPIISPQDAQIFKKSESSNIQSSEKDDIGVRNIPSSSGNQQLSLRVLKSTHISVNHDDPQGEKLSKEQKRKNSSLDCAGIKFANKSNIIPTDFSRKKLFVVIDDCFKNVRIDMVNCTAQHPKSRNPSNVSVTTNSSSNTTSNNSTVSTRDLAVVKEHITNDTIKIMTTKSPLSTHVIEVNDKKTKEVSLSNQQHTIVEGLDKSDNFEKIQNDSSGLSLRTRTISSTIVPTLLNQSTVSSVTSVQPMCPSTGTGPRPRGRPPLRKNLNRIANGKKLKAATSQQPKQTDESKASDSISTFTRKETATTSVEHLHKQHTINQCNGIDNYYNDQENNVDTINKHSKLFPEAKKSKECPIIDLTGKKKCGRKRKQSDVIEIVPKKQLLISENSKNSLVIKKSQPVNELLPDKSNVVVDSVKYGFLFGCDIVEPFRHISDINASTSMYHSYFYGRTYWPTNWEYSAAALTGHVQKKATKDTLRKIRLICGENSTKFSNTISTPLKTNLTFKKYQTSVIQRRGSASKLTASSSIHPIPSTSSSTIVKRQKGRPPGKKNKLLQALLKSNSSRKSPRQHASTLAAIMSNKVTNTNGTLESQQSDQLVELEDTVSNKNSLDMDGPCILKIAVPKHEHMPEFRHHRYRRQLDRQHNIIKRRRRRHSITPPPPKLCAQQPAPQRIAMNTGAVDQEVVKLRTKHVDVVRRRARDERLRAAFVCQQLHRVQKIAEKNRLILSQEVLQTLNESEEDNQISSNTLKLPLESSQDQIWSHQSEDNNQQPDNMCLQIMYEQTADKRFLSTNLTDETLKLFSQQRDLALAERFTNNHDNMSDLGIDMISVGNKRKKKRPNMTGWPKEKRRKVVTNTSTSMMSVTNTLNGDDNAERNEILKRKRAAAALQQRLRRQRIKLEQQQLLANQNSNVKVVTATIPKRPGRPCRSGRPGRPKRPGGPGQRPGRPGQRPGGPVQRSVGPGRRPGRPSRLPGRPGRRPGRPGRPGRRPGRPGRPGRLPGRPGRRPGSNKNNKTETHHRTTSVSSNGTASSSTDSITSKETKITVQKRKRGRKPGQIKTELQTECVDVTTIEPATVVKRSCGRPRGSMGKRQRLKIKLQGRRRSKTSLSCELQKENVVREQTSSGKLKCVISTRNNKMKLLSTPSSNVSGTSNQKKMVTSSKMKKSNASYNLSSSDLTSLPSPVTVVGKTTRITAKRRRLQQQQQQMTTATVTWDAGRPKRYHSTNNGRNGVAIEEDCCFVGSQPFEQHCPGGGGLSQNTVLENQHDRQKENTVQVGGL